MRRINLLRAALAGAFTLMMAACSSNGRNEPKAADSATSTTGAATNRQEFEVRGVVEEVKSQERRVVIKHEEIPNYMPAMTMPFDVKELTELNGIAKGDEVLFRMVVTEDDGWIENVRKTGVSTNTAPAAVVPRFRPVRDVEPLTVGDVMPNYSFTNSFGNRVSFSDFKGQAIVFTFIFTRCPFPTFCPRMNMNLEKAYTELTTRAGAPTNWHLFSISFDPEWDTPKRLATYAKAYTTDLSKWDFVTGAMIDIDAITEQIGLVFTFQQNTFNHNLRTVVVDAAGKIQDIFVGNEWKPEELANAIVKAAQVNATP